MLPLYYNFYKYRDFYTKIRYNLFEVNTLKKTKTKKNKILWGRIIDLLYLVLFPIVSIFLILLIKKFTNKYTIVVTLLVVIIYLLCILSFALKKRSVDIFRRFAMIVLCGGLIFATISIKNINDGFTAFTDSSSTDSIITSNLDLLVLKNHQPTLNNVEDLEGLVIGFQTASDQLNAAYVKEEVTKAIGDTFQELNYEDYNTMFNDYYNGYVDAIVVNQEQKQQLDELYISLYEDSTVINTYVHNYKDEISGNDIDITSDVFTVYISASDEVNAPASNSLSDMNMIMIVNPKTNSIMTIPVPRDSFVPNPALQNLNDKLTHTGSYGITNSVAAIEETFQMEIDFYVKISFTSLIEIVDTLGGINVNVLSAITEQDENRSFEDEDLIHLEAGYQLLNGKQALAYSRHRHSYEDQDLGRNLAQLEVMKGIIARMASAEGISKIDDVLKILPKYVIMNFSNTQISSFIKEQVDNLKPWTINSIELNHGLDDLRITASDSITPLSIYYLSEFDLRKANAFYSIAKQALPLSDFSFDMEDLYTPYSNFIPNEKLELVP